MTQCYNSEATHHVMLPNHMLLEHFDILINDESPLAQSQVTLLSNTVRNDTHNPPNNKTLI